MQTNLTQIQGNIKFMMIKEAKGKKFSKTEDVYKFMQAEAMIDRECAWVLHLNGKNAIIEKELVSMGTVNNSLLQPREVFRRAIIEGASAIIIVHNHPSGDATPSETDINCSTQLKQASDLLNIPILDFVIIGKTYYSFADVQIGGFE